jgi:hypothetical protein
MTRQKGYVRKKNARYSGLREAATALGVRYEHLWQCVSGRRQSRSLMARYALYKRQQAAAAKLLQNVERIEESRDQYEQLAQKERNTIKPQTTTNP